MSLPTERQTYLLWEFLTDATVIQVVALHEIEAREKALGIINCNSLTLVKVVECFDRNATEDDFRGKWISTMDKMMAMLAKQVAQ